MDIHAHLLLLTFAFVVLDFVSGVAKGVKAEGRISSKKMREGLFHKGAYGLAIALAYIIEAAMTVVDLGIEIPIVMSICVYIILTEITSVLENIAELNPDLANNGFMGLFHSSKLEQQQVETHE